MRPARAILLFFFVFASALFLFGNNQQNQIVYVTATGQAYHLDGCTSLQRTQFAVSLIDAVKSGFRPCSRCRPPIISNPASIQRNTTPLYRVNVEGLTRSSDADVRRMLRADVISHIDGDTIRVRIPNPPEGLSVIEVIRFIGVDAPETVHPTREPEPFGQESSDFVRNALFGRTVYLAFDWDLRDRFGRLLAYIYTPDGRCFNAILIYLGYAEALLRFPFQFMDEFRLLEQAAQRARRGLWGL